MHSKFTEQARKVIYFAREEASRLQHDSIGTEHLLLGILREREGVAATVLNNLGLDLDLIRLAVENTIAQGGGTLTINALPFTSNAKTVLELAVDEARQSHRDSVGSEHLLLALIRQGEGVAAQVLTDVGVDRKKVRDETLKLLGPLHQANAGDQEEGSETPSLAQFGRDLTQLAREGKLDPIFGRVSEIERVIQVLCRRQKNNPILIGEPGVGKTAIVEGLAQQIVEGKVPELLRGCRLVALDLTSVSAGTKYRGQYEERLKSIVNELREVNDTIIFIDELHAFFGAAGGEGARDASNMLKPALARGEVRCIGTTTPNDYREIIERDSALDRHFQAVHLHRLTNQATVNILRSLRDKYEAHHRVRYMDEALVAAVDLAELYMPARPAPMAAIEIIDEAGSRSQLSRSETPKELRDLEIQIEQIAAEKEANIRAQQFETAAAYRDKEKELREEYFRLRKEWRERREKDPVRRAEVDEESIYAAASLLSGVAIDKIRRRERLQSDRGSDGGAAAVLGVPAFERHQTESVLLGRDVRIRRGYGFVLLPHNDEFREIFEQVVVPAMEANGLKAIKAEDIFKPGSILGQVWDWLRSAEVVVADVSGLNPNVIYELGLCYGLGRCPILLVRSPSELPFNLRSLRYIEYRNTAKGAAELKSTLTEYIRVFLASVRPARDGLDGEAQET